MKQRKRRMRETLEVTGLRKKYDKTKSKFIIDIRYKTRTLWTERTESVAEAFGIGLGKEEERVIYDKLELEIGPKDILYITGESGSGKSVLLRALAEDLGEEAVNMAEAVVEEDRPIIDTVGKTLQESLELLSKVGLNDAYLFLRPYNQLSDGQKYRYRLAKLMESSAQYWIADEFCSTLDRTTARIVAFNVQKMARRMGRSVLAATAHEDLFQDLAPSVHVKKGLGSRLEVRYFPNRINERCSIAGEMRIEQGTAADYRALAEFHYRSHRLPPPVAIYVMRRGEGLVGVIAYCYPGVNSFGRREALGRRVPVKELNRDFAVISRVVIHPRYRSIGLGRRIVEETLPLVGRRYVEAMAVMAQYNPFFEKAGMKKVTEIRPDEGLLEVGEDLR
ncbi:MAG: ATP-binding cassette domain-containing protein, partial [Candidatus Bathyarchaeia archaeon]